MLFVLRFFLIPLVTVVHWGCGGSEPSDLWEEAERATADQNMDEAVDAYSEFVRIYPQHEKAPAALKNWAAVAQQKGDMQGAITLYERLLDEYPQSDLGDEAQFMIAFIYEEYLNDIEKARGRLSARHRSLSRLRTRGKCQTALAPCGPKSRGVGAFSG